MRWWPVWWGENQRERRLGPGWLEKVPLPPFWVPFTIPGEIRLEKWPQKWPGRRDFCLFCGTSRNHSAPLLTSTFQQVHTDEKQKQQHNSPLRVAFSTLAGGDLEAPSSRLCRSHLLGSLQKQCGVVERPWGQQSWAESPPVGLLGCVRAVLLPAPLTLVALFIKGE